MPWCAIENVPVDHIVPMAEIDPILVRLPTLEESKIAMPPDLETETKGAEFDIGAIETPREGKPLGYAYPDRHGTLCEVQEGEVLRFRCRVGHVFSPEGLARRPVRCAGGCLVDRSTRPGRKCRPGRPPARARGGARAWPPRRPLPGAGSGRASAGFDHPAGAFGRPDHRWIRPAQAGGERPQPVACQCPRG